MRSRTWTLLYSTVPGQSCEHPMKDENQSINCFTFLDSFSFLFCCCCCPLDVNHRRRRSPVQFCVLVGRTAVWIVPSLWNRDRTHTFVLNKDDDEKVGMKTFFKIRRRPQSQQQQFNSRNNVECLSYRVFLFVFHVDIFKQTNKIERIGIFFCLRNVCWFSPFIERIEAMQTSSLLTFDFSLQFNLTDWHNCVHTQTQQMLHAQL